MAKTPHEIIEEVEQAVAADDLERLNRMAEDYFDPAEAGPQPFSAAIKLSERGKAAVARESFEALPPVEESALALNAANAVERGRRLIKYRRRIRDQPDATRIVAEGDSWFQYPFLLSDVVDVLMEKYAVNCICAAGDTVENMVRSGEYLQAIADEKPALFVFSGGGNDLVGNGKLRTILRRFSSGAAPEALIDDAVFNGVLSTVIEGFETVVRDVARRFPGLRVLSHGYDHPRNLENGPWIWPYMQEKEIAVDMARKVIAVMLDRLNDRLAQLSRRHPHFVHLRVIGSVGDNSSSWYDALHPRDPGYRRVADHFIETIDKLVAESGRTQESIASHVSNDVGGLRTSAHGGERRSNAMPACRAIQSAYSMQNVDYPVWEDFGPESEWLAFDDPDVRKHIKDVISLLERRQVPESPRLVDNRLRLGMDPRDCHRRVS